MALFQEKPSAPKVGDGRTKRLTRRQAAEKLGCGESSVRRAESKGLLTPHSDRFGVTRYDASEVNRLAARRRGPKREGELASLAFMMFADGSTIADVVIECACTPDVASKLYDQWRALRTKSGAT